MEACRYLLATSAIRCSSSVRSWIPRVLGRRKWIGGWPEAALPTEASTTWTPMLPASSRRAARRASRLRRTKARPRSTESRTPSSRSVPSAEPIASQPAMQVLEGQPRQGPRTEAVSSVKR